LNFSTRLKRIGLYFGECCWRVGPLAFSALMLISRH